MEEGEEVEEEGEEEEGGGEAAAGSNFDGYRSEFCCNSVVCIN